MLVKLHHDGVAKAKDMREGHKVSDDVATSSLPEDYIDETDKRTWFLLEAVRSPDHGGH